MKCELGEHIGEMMGTIKKKEKFKNPTWKIEKITIEMWTPLSSLRILKNLLPSTWCLGM
jgi:hypothetical protein